MAMNSGPCECVCPRRRREDSSPQESFYADTRTVCGYGCRPGPITHRAQWQRLAFSPRCGSSCGTFPSPRRLAFTTTEVRCALPYKHFGRPLYRTYNLRAFLSRSRRCVDGLLPHHTPRWSSICGILGRVASAAVPSSIAGPYYAISHLAMASLVMACSSFVLSVLYWMFDDTSLTRISRQCRRDRDLLE